MSGVTPQNILTHPSKPRNPTLAQAARTLGLAEEVGRGVDRMYREMIRSGRDLPRIESSADSVTVVFVGGAPKASVARFVAQLPSHERDDTDTLLVLLRLGSVHALRAQDMAVRLQKSVEETEAVLRRLAADAVAIVEPTRETARRAHPSYRLRASVVSVLGNALPYRRRTVDDIDRKVIAHLRPRTRSGRRVRSWKKVLSTRARQAPHDASSEPMTPAREAAVSLVSRWYRPESR